MKNPIFRSEKKLELATISTTPDSTIKKKPLTTRLNSRLTVAVTLAMGVAISCLSMAYAQEITEITVPTVEGDSATPQAAKKPIDTALTELQDMYLNLSQQEQENLESEQGISITDGRVIVEAIAKGSASNLLAELESLGLENGAVFGKMISGSLPLSQVSNAGVLPGLVFLRLAQRMTRTGAVDNQGDIAMQSDLARATFGVDGTGVSIGIMSDSYNTLGGEGADIASGDLPSGGVTILDDSVAGSDEGRAMAQLIHDIAPGSDLLFHTAFNGAPDFAQGIVDLAIAGANVIVDDVGYFAAPMFQDGVIAQAVDLARTLGVAYFSAAGNSADQSYEADYVDSGLSFPSAPFTLNNLHDFDSGPAVDIIQEFALPPGGSILLSIQWDEPSASTGGLGSAIDLDAYIVDVTGTIIVNAINNNIGNDAVELISYTNPTSTTRLYGLVIGVFVGSAPGKIKWVDFRSDTNGTTNHQNFASTTFGHPNAEGAIAVGAAYYPDTPPYGQSPPLIEPFSSHGGTEILFDVAGNSITPLDRGKPEIVAPDGVDNTFFGSDSDGTGFPNFFGTSAAAPNAAALAALQLQCDPNLSPADIETQQTTTAVDMESNGFDNISGYGLVDAVSAVNLACAPLLTCNGLPVTVNFNLGQTTTAGPDVVFGTPGPDDIRGKGGDDTICGMGGDDFIHGNSGDDVIFGGDGVDDIRGGRGDDIINTGLGATVGTASKAFGGYDNDLIFGDADADDLRGGKGIDEIYGYEGDDEINGNDDKDFLFGGADDDTIKGGLGNDELYGDSGADFLNGGSGTEDLCVDDGNPGDSSSGCEIFL